MDRGTMSGHEPVRDDPGDPLVLRAATIGHRMAMGPGEPALSEWAAAGLDLPDETAMMRYRLDRTVKQLEDRDLDGILLFDPMNVMYVTYAPNMQVWLLHNQARYVFVGADGTLVLFDYPNCEFLSAHNPFVTEVRTAVGFTYFLTGDRMEAQAKGFAQEIAALARAHGSGTRRIAVDSSTTLGIRSLLDEGLELVEGTRVMEEARKIKGLDELKAMRCSVQGTFNSCRLMHEAMQPGMTENQVWGVLWAEMLARHGEWMECRLLSAGPRTNPWFQECSSYQITNGDLVAFDTDLVGAYGMMTDISRTWVCGDAPPSLEARHAHELAVEQLTRNIELVRPGATFHELTHRAWFPPEDEYRHYSCLFHGVGQCDEYPSIVFPSAWEASGYDGVLEPGMVVTVEAYVGARSGGQGVKLEDQVLVTEDGYENLSPWTLDLDRFEPLG
ncbi:MAG: Xaa-Pro peptidase family protein [Actinomycetota bacterium]|nr:Xaa-Pro peptidase family protein [Actinomycetota bacterium]MEE2957569.1 Xaa-Pro peptidase family protein [Actinomycetota bacterium]